MISEILSQEKYKDGNGHDLSASEVDCVTTYKHVIDGFYQSECAECGEGLGSRSCGWSIAGLVERCSKCGKRNLILRNDIDWVNECLEKASSQESEIRLLKQQVEELEKYRDSEPAKLIRKIEELQGRLEQIKRLTV